MSDFTIVAAYGIFLFSYIVFAIGKFPGMKIDRPGAAIVGAVLMVASGAVRPSEAIRFIDLATVILLFSMMVLVAYLHLAGFFSHVTAAVVHRLKPHHLLPTVIFLSGTLSAFFVNDIICLVMVPFTLAAARQMRLQPAPYLIAVATASNIGSVATITGNPQNMLIGSVSGIPYVRFLAYLGPVALGGLFLNWLIIWVVATRRAAPAPVGAAGSPPPDRVPEPPAPHTGVAKPGLVAGLVFAGFLAGFPPPLVAAVGAAVMLISRTRDPQHVYRQVDWGLLVFFLGLFVIVGGAENAGLTRDLLAWSPQWDLRQSGAFILVTAGLSNIVSNVPAVMLLRSLVSEFADPQKGWLLLAMASTLAGNLTITGSVANIIVVERAKPEAEITFWQYFRVGLPVTTATLILGWLWLSFLG